MSIKAEHLTYKYGDGTAFEQYALKDVNFEIPDGQFVGLIGHTGSGKSTLIQHLNGLIKPTSGRILYNGTDIHSEGYSLKKLRSKVGLVFQYPEHQLFEIDVFSDVCFGPKNLGFSDEEIKKRAEEALRLVKLDEKFWKQSPFELSGGQKRRVAIAGVLAMGPEVLILDEATSSIDTRTERIIQESMDRLMHGRTTFVIAHRLSTVRNSDCIMVLEQGRIIERGTHDQLISEKGKYYQLYTGNTIAE